MSSGASRVRAVVSGRNVAGSGALLALARFASALWSSSLALGEGREPDPGAALAGDRRFDAALAVHVEGLSVGDLLGRIAAAARVPIAAAPDVREEKVLVFSPSRPLRDLAGDLAALLNCRWVAEKTGSGGIHYVLSRTAEARQFELRLLAARKAQFLADLDARAHGLGEPPPEAPPAPAPPDPAGRGPRVWLATTFFAGLDAGQREDLFARKRLALALAPLIAGLPLTARDELDRAVAQAQETTPRSSTTWKPPGSSGIPLSGIPVSRGTDGFSSTLATVSGTTEVSH